MGVLDEIARIGVAGRGSPIGAFLVGRQQKIDNQRRDDLLALQQQNATSLGDLRGAQVKALGSPKPQDEFVPLTMEQKKGLNIPETSFAQRNARTGKITIDDAPREGALVDVNIGDDTRNRETKAARDRIRTQNEATKNSLAETAIALGRNRNAPGAAGMAGAGQEFIEGTVGQIPGVGEAISEGAERITGVDAKELSQIRTQARTLVAREIPTIVGDDSGRYTKEEQDISRRTLAQLDALKTSAQIDGALTEIQSIKLRGEVRIRGVEFIEDVVGHPINILTDEGYQEWGNALITQFGLSEEDAFIELERHVDAIRRQ